jgi:hypothetical protein
MSSTREQALDALLAKQACAELMTAYCTHLDARDEPAFLALFDADATLRKLSAPPHVARGHEGIVQALRARPSSLLSRHLLANTTIHLDGTDQARGEAFGMVVRGHRDRETWPMPIKGLELLVAYHMAFRRGPQGWRITDCAIDRVLDIEAAPQGH